MKATRWLPGLLFLSGAVCSLYGQGKVAYRRASAGNAGGGISAFTTGYLYDAEAHALRLVTGRVGAALLGPPIELGVAFTSAAVSPRQDFVLGQGEDGRAWVALISGGIQPPQAIDGLDGRIDQIAISTEGRAALLRSAEAHRIYVVSGFPAAPRIVSTIDTSPLPDGPVPAIAVSDDASSVLLAIGGDDSGIYAANPEGSWDRIGTAGDVAWIRFLRNSRDSLIVDRKQMQLTRLSGRDLRVIAASGQGLSEPTSVAISPANRAAYVSNSGSSSIVVVDLESGAAQSISCECSPGKILPLGARSVFQVTEPKLGTVWVLDASAAEPRLAFIPSAAPLSDATKE